jgi:ribosome-associated heat shock protein Hsp15
MSAVAKSRRPQLLRENADGEALPDPPGGQRLDKWLWFARIAKTRTLAAALVTEGKIRVNGDKAAKPAHILKIGDGVTVVMRQRVRILKVIGFVARRGSAEVAKTTVEDMTPPPPRPEMSPASTSPAQREPGSGRPTKRQRREMDRFKAQSE